VYYGLTLFDRSLMVDGSMFQRTKSARMTEESISRKGARSMGSHPRHKKLGEASTPQTQGAVWNWAWRYDLLIGLATVGREQAFRRRIADLARLHHGEAVLDVGCGTGTLAIIVEKRVGAPGYVTGINPSVQMIARTAAKRREPASPLISRSG
jgi:SAM-dependent methyltransferase